MPLKTNEKMVSGNYGIEFKKLCYYCKNEKGKTIYQDFGEMLFTHFGISGPIILSASRHIVKRVK